MAAAQREVAERAKKEAEARAKREAEERAMNEAEARPKREAEERARKEAEARAKREAEERARKEAGDRARRGSAQDAPGGEGGMLGGLFSHLGLGSGNAEEASSLVRGMGGVFRGVGWEEGWRGEGRANAPHPTLTESVWCSRTPHNLWCAVLLGGVRGGILADCGPGTAVLSNGLRFGSTPGRLNDSGADFVALSR